MMVVRIRSDKVSYNSYRKIFKKLNKSFTKLGEEECKACEEFKLHDCTMLKKDDDTCGEKKECLLCTENEKHLQSVQLTREAYRADVECNTNQNNPYLSMDMQKVLMLPLLPGCKTAIFTRRIFLINQTFAPLGGTRKTNAKPCGYLWHEGIHVYRDSKHVTIGVTIARVTQLCRFLPPSG